MKITPINLSIHFQKLTSYVFCPLCDHIYPGWDCGAITKEHETGHKVPGKHFPGIYVGLDFITAEEENILIEGFDGLPWDVSQSGRRKQNYGPKTNFKKMKLKIGEFKGFPEYSKFIQERFESFDLMKNYQTIEQCSLEYDPSKGASIDPHIDDCWIWGERVVTVNCLSDSVLTLSRFKGESSRYNLPQVSRYKSDLIAVKDPDEIEDEVVVRIPMPRRSLIVLFGRPRYDWEHCVLREDISERRVCIAYREFTPPYLDDKRAEYNKAGKEILITAKQFWNSDASPTKVY